MITLIYGTVFAFCIAILSAVMLFVLGITFIVDLILLSPIWVPLLFVLVIAAIVTAIILIVVHSKKQKSNA